MFDPERKSFEEIIDLGPEDEVLEPTDMTKKIEMAPRGPVDVSPPPNEPFEVIHSQINVALTKDAEEPTLVAHDKQMEEVYRQAGPDQIRKKAA